MFFAIIVIVMILVGFVVVSSIFRVFSEAPVGSTSFNDTVEGKSFFEYVDGDYSKLAMIRFGVAKGSSIDLLLEAEDEK